MIAVRTNTAERKSVNQTFEEPKRLSKIGQWRRDNPGGIIVVHDRRAVNK